MYHYVYIVINNLPLNENIYYIGSRTCDCNPSEDVNYYGSSKYLKADINIQGKKCFSKYIISLHNTRHEAYLRENELQINFRIGNNNKFYNRSIQTLTGFNTMGLVTVKDINGKTSSVSKTNIKYLSGELIPVSCGLVSVKDINGKTSKVKVTDPRYLSGELVHNCDGLATVKDINGKTSKVKVTDPRYLSGELVHIFKDTVSVKDINGKNIRVSTTDPRYLRGELIPVSCGLVTVKDINGKNIRVSTTDPRYISGVLKGIQYGENNPGFKGWYITPWGIYSSSYDIPCDLITYRSIQLWCKNTNKKISNQSISHSKYLTNDMLGLTYKDIGFDFIPK